jgi:hypothetical protein
LNYYSTPAKVACSLMHSLMMQPNSMPQHPNTSNKYS